MDGLPSSFNVLSEQKEIGLRGSPESNQSKLQELGKKVFAEAAQVGR